MRIWTLTPVTKELFYKPRKSPADSHASQPSFFLQF